MKIFMTICTALSLETTNNLPRYLLFMAISNGFNCYFILNPVQTMMNKTKFSLCDD